MPVDPTQMVVVVTPTIMDGTVVRWYRNLATAEGNRELISAGRNGVMTGPGVYLTDIPDDLIDQAKTLHDQLRRERRPDLSHLATHSHRGFLGPLVAIAKDTADA